LPLIYLYRKPVLSETQKNNILHLAREKVSREVEDIQTEYCFYIESHEPLTPGEKETLLWLLRETFEPHCLSSESFLGQ